MSAVRIEPATVEQLEALVAGDDAFTARFGVAVIDGWAGFPEAVPYALAEARSAGSSPWGTHLFFDASDGALVGFGGWKGPPVDGAAELGYAIAPARQGRGLATAVVHELLARGRAAGLRTVLAHTLPEDNPSTSVLRKTGFTLAGPVTEDGETVWRWQLPLEPH